MKNIILSLFAVFALMSSQNPANAQSDCNIDFVYDILNASINIQAIDFPAGAELTWSINGTVFEIGTTDILISIALLLQGPVELCVSYSSLDCPDGITFCEMVDITNLGDCVDLSLINPLVLCSTEWAPVCGCDGNTYPNDCVATNYGGVTSWTDGECGGGGGDCPMGLFASMLELNTCNWIFEVENAMPGALVEWSFGDGTFETSSYVADHAYSSDGIYEVSAFYIDDLCSGVLLTTTIEVFACTGDVPCSIEMWYELYYDPIEELGYGVFEAHNYPEGVELFWTMNDEVIATGVDWVQIYEPIPYPVGGVTICVGYESADCPLGAFACEWIGEDGEGTCDLDFAGFYEEGFGVFEAYNYPDSVTLIWAVNGEVIAEGTNFVELYDMVTIDGFELCVFYENAECGLVETCEWIGGKDEVDCPTEIYTIMPKWDMCSWAFEIGSSNEWAEVQWNFGDGSEIEVGLSWAIHAYETDGTYIVTALYYGEDCPYGVELHITIIVEGCGDVGDCINEDQIDTEFACTEEYVPVCGCNNVTYSNACYAYHYGGVTTFVEGECETSINDIEEVASWTVYPTPTTGNLVISGLDEGIWPCKMYDSQGRIVLTTEVSNGQEFSLYGLSDGWYTLQIVGVLGSAKRVIVQR